MKNFLALLILSVALLLPGLTRVVAAAPSCNDAPGVQLCNPFETPNKDSGGKLRVPPIRNFTEFGIFILQVFAGTGGIGAILYTTFSGFRFLISQGNEERVSKAKESLRWTLSGLVLMMVSYILVVATQKALDYRGVSNPDQLDNPIGLGNFTVLYRQLIEQFFIILGAVAIFMIIVSGYRYITAGGNEEQAHDARKGIQYAVLGIVISLLAYVIVHSVGVFFGRD